MTAIVAARSLYQRKHPGTRLEDLIIYTTSQTHSLGAKAGLVLGLSTRILDVTAEVNFALRGETLKRALFEDEQAGKKPFILSTFLQTKFSFLLLISLVATVGTTSSGAVDCLPEIGTISAH